MQKRTQRNPKSDRLTVLREPAWRTACVYAVCVPVGAALGLLAGPLADRLVALPWAPMQGPAELVASIPAPWLLAAGALAGLALALIAHYEQLAIRLSATASRSPARAVNNRSPEPTSHWSSKTTSASCCSATRAANSTVRSAT
ncbi:hypothetical protein [Actinomadura sp. CNU-125]|uniref:YqeB family protein n=1 Tax=Actinomadura sp. CNU-125 TaxID=1904961 RepID=UPI0021CCC09A|nr:hypothetical protein [Actinomadura sp. CNU-125]